MSLKNVLSKIISGRDEVCCLCLQDVGESPIHIEDEVIWDSEHRDTEKMLEILYFIIGTEEIKNMQTIGSICGNCKFLAVTSYKFIKMCKANSQDLVKAIISITESFENTLQDVDWCQSLFVSLNTNNFTSQQYYDDKHPVTTLKAANKRYRAIVNAKLRPLQKVNNPQSKYDHTPQVRIKRKVKKEHKPNEENEFDIPSIPTSHIISDIHQPFEFKCKVCFSSLKDETKLRRHYFRIHYPRNVKCPRCPKRFITKQFMIHHKISSHSPVVCTECGKSFTNKYVLRKHEQTHSGGRICCEDCGRVYSGSDAFKKHITDAVCQQKLRKTAQQAQYQCDHCKKQYCYKPYLAKHIKYEHGNAEGFRCKFCKKVFYHRSNLDVHIVKHTQEKKFVCLDCGNQFATKTSLLYHTRIHTGVKPYQCEHCDKAFLSASRRLDHVRRHHMPPSLECDICHGKFKATGSLLKHRKRHFNPNSRLMKIIQHVEEKTVIADDVPTM